MKRKQVIFLACTVVALMVLGILLSLQKLFTSKDAPVASPSPVVVKKKISDPVNIIPVGDRPYIVISPDTTGKHVVLNIKELKKPSTGLDYELEYQSGELLQGAFGNIDTSTMPVQKDILLGSCSAGGACSYHANVKGGSFLAKFNASESFAVKTDWKFFENNTKEKQISSKDAKFQMESPGLAKIKYAVVYNSPGYPGTPPGEVISDIYTFSTSSPVLGEAKLLIRATQEASEAIIVGWDGKSWLEFSSKVDGKNVSASVDHLEAYLVVKK